MSRTFPFFLVDAFSSQPFAGNACAVIMGADSLDSFQMLSIAKEMNQSETAFLMKSDIADLRARYFTPECEIPLAGHPTIASVHVALEAGIINCSSGPLDILLELNEGPIRVCIEKNAAGVIIRMFQRKPTFFEIHDPDIVLPIFGLNKNDLLPNGQIQTVSTGTRQLMVPLKSHEALKKLSMNISAYKEYRDKMNFFSPHFFCLEGATPKGQTFARHLGVPPDAMEDSFTGSATGGMAAYLYKYGFLETPTFVAEQGHWMGRPGVALVNIFGSRNDIESVSVAGEAVTVISGTLNF